ncbi:MAG: hypothetical protein ACXAE3_07010 [Candidatus Kariarchaeaceae archaeon]|jgi:hypothetical protein
MADLISENANFSKERLLTAICLIMMIEHKKLSLSDIIHATGMEFNDIRAAMQNLVNLRLISVLPTQSGIPQFQTLNLDDAREYLHVLGVNAPISD